MTRAVADLADSRPLAPGLAQPGPPSGAASAADDRRHDFRLRLLRPRRRLHRASLRGAEGGHDPQRRAAPVVDRRAVGRARGGHSRVRHPGRASRTRRRRGAARTWPPCFHGSTSSASRRSGARSIPFLGIGVDPGPEAAATLASGLVVSGKYLSGDGGEGIVLGTGLAEALQVKVGDRVTLLATTPDGSSTRPTASSRASSTSRSRSSTIVTSPPARSSSRICSRARAPHRSSSCSSGRTRTKRRPRRPSRRPWRPRASR